MGAIRRTLRRAPPGRRRPRPGAAQAARPRRQDGAVPRRRTLRARDRRQGRHERVQRRLGRAGATSRPGPRSTTPTPGSPGSCTADRRLTVSLHPSVAAVRHAVRRDLADLDPGARLIVACSGGADSLALASATVFEGRDQGWYVVGATVDHGLQEGSDTRADAVVAQLATIGVDETVAARATVEAPGLGPEAAARAGRYAVLEQLRGELRRRPGPARAHPRRPGRDGAARPHPRLGRPRAGRDAPVLRPLPAAAPRRLPYRHRDGVPGRGPADLGRPPQRRPRVHPGPRTPSDPAPARGRARARA